MTRPFTTPATPENAVSTPDPARPVDHWKIEIRPADDDATNEAVLVAKSSLWAAELMVPLSRADPSHIVLGCGFLMGRHGVPDTVRLPWTSNCDALADELRRRGVTTTRLFRFTPAQR